MACGASVIHEVSVLWPQILKTTDNHVQQITKLESLGGEKQLLISLTKLKVTFYYLLRHSEVQGSQALLLRMPSKALKHKFQFSRETEVGFFASRLQKDNQMQPELCSCHLWKVQVEPDPRKENPQINRLNLYFLLFYSHPYDNNIPQSECYDQTKRFRI